jgi:phosphoribosyl-ATP pyrophosphohydrolase
MIIPSIDLKKGRAVQLVGGKELRIDAGDPRPWMERFAVAGEVAVIDLDAAMGEGENAETIAGLLPLGRCRVGGGIRDAETARAWLDRGAAKVILGTAARREVLSQLPRERVVAAVDALDGEVMVGGWRTRTHEQVEDRIAALAPYVGGFLVTFIEREGRLVGIDCARAAALVERAGGVPITFAGGIRGAEDVAALDRLGADAQVGMALYAGQLDLGDALAAPLTTDRADGLFPTVVADVHGVALGLVYSSRESIREAVRTRTGVYASRSRGLWRKGETSGATQELVEVRVDCDRDALSFVVRQRGAGFCHRGAASCFGGARGLGPLEVAVHGRAGAAAEGSYTRRLLADPGLLGAKLREEAAELAAATTRDDVIHEAADVLYFTMVRMAAAGATLEDVERELARRGLRVTRRPGDAKERGAA